MIWLLDLIQALFSRCRQDLRPFTISAEGKEVVLYPILGYMKGSKRFLIYTDDSTDEEGYLRVFAARVSADEKGLSPIQNRRDWKTAESIIKLISFLAAHERPD